MFLLTLLACGLDFGNASVVTDVQIVATVIEPPEVFPDEAVSITITVADPFRRDLEALIWMCLPYEGRCLESYLPARTWARVADVVGEEANVTFHGTDLGNLDLGRDRVLTTINALVCEADTCPIIEVVRGAGVKPDAALGEALADPESLLRDLPIDGTHYAIKSLPVLLDRAEDRNWNPKVNPQFTRVLSVAAGDILDLEFKITDANGDPATGYGFATTGMFESPKEAVSQSEVTMRWLAPEDDAELVEGRMYVVVEDNTGGAVVWSADIKPR